MNKLRNKPMDATEWVYALARYRNGNISEIKFQYMKTQDPVGNLAIDFTPWQLVGVSKAGADVLDFMDIALKVAPLHYVTHLFGKIGYMSGCGSAHDSWADYVNYLLSNFPDRQMVMRRCDDGLYVCWNDDDRGGHYSLPTIGIK